MTNETAAYIITGAWLGWLAVCAIAADFYSRRKRGKTK